MLLSATSVLSILDPLIPHCLTSVFFFPSERPLGPHVFWSWPLYLLWYRASNRNGNLFQGFFHFPVATWSVTCIALLFQFQSVMLLLHSQRRYIFEYDQSDYLLSVTMPSMVRHGLQTMLSVGYYRNIYTPPDSSTAFIQDFTRDGRLLQTLYPGTGRRILYKYTKQSRLSEILYDTAQVTFTYEESSGVIKTIHLMHDGFICTIRYRQTGLLDLHLLSGVIQPALLKLWALIL